MRKQVNANLFHLERKDRILFDVRTPGEFAKGHIPGAKNLPLFSDEERVVVGTTYKQIGPEEALLKGLDFVGGKMRSFIKEAAYLAPDKKVMIHCWRGGKRSGSMAWLLETAGFDVAVLEGGYKAYRNHLLNSIGKIPHHFLVVGGYTGSGKTDILKALQEMGEVVVDLEGLANHKGSAFGALGEKQQPTVEQFENDLFHCLLEIEPGQRVWLESESRSIGRVYLPEGLWEQLVQAPLIHLDLPIALRVKRLVKEYAHFDKAELKESFDKIARRLGGQHHQAAYAALEVDDFSTAAEIALQYYDKAYHLSLQKRRTIRELRLEIGEEQPRKTAKRLIELIENEYDTESV